MSLKKYYRPFGECLKCPITARFCNKKTKGFSCEFKSILFLEDIILKKSYINVINKYLNYGRKNKKYTSK